MPVTAVLSRSDALLTQGRTTKAVGLVNRAAETGDADALFRLAAWRLVGDVLPRDLPIARALLRRAVTAGHTEAGRIEIALTANGGGAAASWPDALALLRRMSASDGQAGTQLNLIEGMRLDDDGRPLDVPATVGLSDDPYVRRISRLLTREECAHLAHAASDLLEPAAVVDPATGRMVANPVRTSEAAVIGPMREDPVVRAINLRLAAVSGTDVAQGEALTILRYRPGQQFRPHLDAIGGQRNQRVLTVLVYLNEGYGGGETQFPHVGLTIAPRAGDAIVFRNTSPDGRIDTRSLHAGLPVTRGEKWLATRWIRARAFDPWRGPEAT